MSAMDQIKKGLTLYVGKQILDIPIPKALVAGRFQEQSLTFVLGEPGVGKTFWVLSYVLAVATGQSSWLGADLHPDIRGRAVVYALAEGAGSFQLRLMGALQALQQDAIPDAFIFTKDSLRLDLSTEVAALIEQTRQYKPAIVIVDTYQRHGGPESEEEKVSKAIEYLTSIKEQLGCQVIGVHHLPKDGRQTPRGHGAIDGSLDTAVYLTRDDHNVITARFEQRDLEPSVFAAQLKTVEVEGYLNDLTGLPQTTCVLAPLSAHRAKRAASMTQREQDLMRALLGAVRLNPGINQQELCKTVGGKKATAVAEIARLVGTGHLKNTQTTSRTGITINHFELGAVPF